MFHHKILAFCTNTSKFAFFYSLGCRHCTLPEAASVLTFASQLIINFPQNLFIGNAQDVIQCCTTVYRVSNEPVANCGLFA